MIPSQFGADAVSVEAETELYRGFFRCVSVRLRHRLFGGGWSAPLVREVFTKPSAAAAIPYDPVHDLVGLVEQLRPGMLGASGGAWSLEGVAGMLESDESAEVLITRELREEAGLTARTLLPITEFYPLPGSCDESIELYCALCDLSAGGGHFGLAHEGEDIQFHVRPAAEVLAAMLTDRTNNAATLIGLLWLQRERERLRADYGSAPPDPS